MDSTLVGQQQPLLDDDNSLPTYNNRNHDGQKYRLDDSVVIDMVEGRSELDQKINVLVNHLPPARDCNGNIPASKSYAGFGNVIKTREDNLSLGLDIKL